MRKPLYQRDGRKTLGIIGAFAAALFIVGYALFAAYPYLRGPSLTLRAETESGITRISGETERVSYLALNGAEIAVAEDGSFSVERAYPAGYTTVTATGRDRFDRTITKTLTFVTAPATSTSYGTQEEN